MQKKNLLLITQGFPYGNKELSFLSVEYSYLAKMFNVSILAYDNKEELKYNIENGTNITRYCYKNDLSKARNVVKALFSAKTIDEIKLAIKNVNFLTALKRIKQILFYNANAIGSEKIIEKIVEHEKIDLIYSYWCSPQTLAALYLKEKKGINVVTRAHGIDLYNERTNSKWQPFRYYIAKQCDLITLVSECGKKYFDSHWGGKTHVAYIGTPERKVLNHNKNSKFVLISCSNLIELKRVDKIIEALSLLQENVIIEWHHFGDGPLKSELQIMAEKKLGDKENVEYLFEGFVENECMINKYYEISPSLFITASETEGNPISIQEAMSMGIPIVATTVGGIPEIVENERNGFLVDENCTGKDLADIISKFYFLPPEKKLHMSQEAVKVWRNTCDANENANRFVSLLLKLTENV